MKFKKIKMPADSGRYELRAVMAQEKGHQENISYPGEGPDAEFTFTGAYVPAQCASVAIIIDKDASSRKDGFGYYYEIYVRTPLTEYAYHYEGLIKESAFEPALYEARCLAEKFFIACMQWERSVSDRVLKDLDDKSIEKEN